MTKSPDQRVPPAPPPKREPLSRREAVYLDALKHWFKYRPGVAPRLKDLSSIIKPKRSTASIRAALCSAESKGYCRRNRDGRFEVTP